MRGVVAKVVGYVVFTSASPAILAGEDPSRVGNKAPLRHRGNLDRLGMCWMIYYSALFVRGQIRLSGVRLRLSVVPFVYKCLTPPAYPSRSQRCFVAVEGKIFLRAGGRRASRLREACFLRRFTLTPERLCS